MPLPGNLRSQGATDAVPSADAGGATGSASMAARSAMGMRIVLAYSGGLDTSVILHWIRERYDAEVIAYTADVQK